ncbi:MAG: hypothetical protein ABIR63_04080 [Sphingomicrobium sp.]
MMNMWSNWQRMMRAGTMVSETLDASRKVVGHRQETIGAAIGDPLGDDYPELSRMVSEKADAFGAAGLEVSRTWLGMQCDFAAQWADMSSIMLGQWPGPRKALAMAARGERLSRAALSGSVRAMTPIHRTATANARRLGRG